MKFLILSDIHGKADRLSALDGEFKAADAVFFGGDFAEFEHTETAAGVLEELLKKHESIFGVLGNCDDPAFLSEIEGADVSVQGSMVFHDGLVIAGSGGGSKFTGTTPFERTEEELVSDFDILNSSLEQISDEEGKCRNLVLIMHNPPKDTKCDKIPGGIHVGSQLLRDFIEKMQPLFVVTGHIHESAGIDKIGDTTVMNPGSLAEGKYGIIEAEKEGGVWKVTSAELKSL